MSRGATRRLQRALGSPALFWALTIVNLLPLFAVEHLPFTDLPEHVAAMATIEQLLPGGRSWGAMGPSPYVLALRDSQYLTYHVLGALLTRFAGDAVLANRLLMALIGLTWPLALRSLLRALGRDDRAAAFAPMVFWNRALVIGFLPFVASLPIAVYVVALVIRQSREPSRRRGIALAVVTVLLVYTHISAWLTACAVGGAIALASCWTEKPDAGSRWRPILSVVPAFVPSGIGALVWWSAGSLAIRGQQLDVDRGKLVDAVNLMPLWTFDIWSGRLDDVAAGAWWLAYAIIVAAGLERPLESGGRWIIATLPFAVVALIYLATPSRVGAAGLLNVRLAPLVTLFALVALRVRDDRWGTIPLGMAAAATIFNAGVTTFEMRRVSVEEIGDFDSLLGTMKPGSRLALVNFVTSSRRMDEWPYPFAGALHRARGDGIVGYSFVETPHWSVHYASGAGPPAHPFLWVYNPCVYSFVVDGAYYDYVLVKGAVEPWPPRTPGPPFAPAAHAGMFTLFEKAEGPPFGITEKERGPCNAPRDAGSEASADGGADGSISDSISDADAPTSP